MKIKTSELIGMPLDWAVALANNMPICPSEVFAELHLIGRFNYSTDWAQGGPIIERERIELYEHKQLECWAAKSKADDLRYGPTPLIAAMRCHVVSKLGDEVEVPEELLREL